MTVVERSVAKPVEPNGAKGSQEHVMIKPVNFKTARFDIIGVDPYVSHRFGQKARASMEEIVTRSAADQKGKKRERKARDFAQDFQESRHISTEGWDGINAVSIKAGMVAVCVIKDFFKVRAKMVLFVEPDGFSEDGTPLVRITKGKPKQFTAMARNKGGGADVRVRAKFDPGWEATVTITYDADVFSLESVANLLNAAGLQSGAGEGRPSSKDSVGCGWGRYKVKGI